MSQWVCTLLLLGSLFVCFLYSRIAYQMALVFTWYAYGYYEPLYTFFGGYWFNFIDSLIDIARLLYKKPSDFSSETAVSVHIHHHLVRVVLVCIGFCHRIHCGHLVDRCWHLIVGRIPFLSDWQSTLSSKGTMTAPQSLTARAVRSRWNLRWPLMTSPSTPPLKESQQPSAGILLDSGKQA